MRGRQKIVAAETSVSTQNEGVRVDSWNTMFALLLSFAGSKPWDSPSANSAITTSAITLISDSNAIATMMPEW